VEEMVAIIVERVSGRWKKVLALAAALAAPGMTTLIVARGGGDNCIGNMEKIK